MSINMNYALHDIDQNENAHSRVSGDDGCPILIAGAGPIGQKTAEVLCRRGLNAVLVNGESWQPYNRIKLSSVLADRGWAAKPQAEFRPSGPGEIRQLHDRRIAEILPQRRVVKLENGEALAYSRLLLCLGARAFIPPIAGVETGGVFTFRDLDDVQKLDRRARFARRAVVLGGGLLGLEAARGLAERGIETEIVETAPFLMARQLDAEAGRLLAAKIEQSGIVVTTGTGVRRVLGARHVEGVELADGRILSCDMLVICAGVRPNIELAARAGLATGRGILVDAAMRTSDPHIFAAGDCTEFSGAVTGLVAPGLEQARVMVENAGGGAVLFAPTVVPTKLKVIGIDVYSLGEVCALEADPTIRKLTYRDAETENYHVIFARESRILGVQILGAQILGALGVGEWPDLARLNEVIRKDRRFWRWQFHRFEREGLLWPEGERSGARALPASAIICNCTGVTRGEIDAAIRSGSASYEAIKAKTGASTVCGSCKPAIEELLGGTGPRTPIEAYKPLAIASLAACLVGVLLGLFPAISFADSIAARSLLDRLWTDSLLRQITGFTLLGFAVMLALLSVRKRIARLKLGSYKAWRLVHAVLGALALAFLYIHTGGRWGNNLNAWLMTAFVAIAVAGGLTGLASAFEHRLTSSPRQAMRLRKGLFWLHVLVSWPLPLLLLAHVLAAYIF